MDVKKIKIKKLKCVKEENGGLVVTEAIKDTPFAIARLFSVFAPVNAIRGEHAHKKCMQYLNVPIGAVEVICDDGSNKVSFLLDMPEQGLLIPAGIWATQIYKKENTILNVLCDNVYDAHDYIRDYKEYLEYIESVRH